ncbi:hypothetical protein [Crocosphaera sp.]|uniref:hypothetical protein n=1 Tax=Crocosphaera sp. TaxID=2729996 RepID=UPI003F297B1E|nr:hypothetical protein [Crocosphaera sp.]
MEKLLTYVPIISSTIIALGVLFGGLFWMLKVIIKVELIPVNMELAALRGEIKETENRIEQRLTRLETLIEAQSKNKNP